MSDFNQRVVLARAIALIAHHGQVDKAGHPYIGHPERVANYLAQRGERDVVIAAGWLHDVLEDTKLTREDLHEAGVDWPTISIVSSVTRQSGVSAEDYYAGIYASVDARRVKEADIADNTNPERLAKLDDATVARLTRKYAKALRHIRGDVADD
jgi:(p)ppGpp synthase/HD superfamily hydrolase